MKRRHFIRNVAYGSAAGITLGGVPMNLLAANSPMARLAADSANDKVLVFIQLHGGNDGLNTLIPISQYDDYYNLRPNIAIRHTGTRSYLNVDETVDENAQVGLHPDMLAFKEMYDQEKVAIIQNVGYPDMNLSHFRGRDVVFMGGDEGENNQYSSGWMGRYLNNIYPGYPDDFPSETMEDPIGIELSGTLSLAFHRENGIPIGLNIGNPDQFYELISSVGVNPPIAIPESHAGDELRYIMEFEKKSNEYAGRLKEVYDAGSNSTVEYPESYPYASPIRANGLSSQLRLIARLIEGGIKTKIFLCRIGGFDTHGEQVDENDPSLGTHAALLYNMSGAVKAFYDDLNQLGIDEKVLSLTFTEFGRRAKSNDSYGTDHGTATPVFVFGTQLNNGIYGVNPSLKPEDLNNYNLVYNIDYRQIYTSIIQDWFEGDDQALIDTGFSDWVDTRLPIVDIGGTHAYSPGKNPTSLQLYPNPVKDMLHIQYNLEYRGATSLHVIDGAGRRLKSVQQEGVFGPNATTLDVSDLKEGMYHLQMIHRGKRMHSSFLKL
ncbi:MAG: hypothetical protein DRI98_04975 [Bacteroidetes bacterium]|nr:MAG: hypothetical protein DRI98_04975 [Bacteroidota bacterium]